MGDLMAPAPYPLVFEPMLKAKVWGGRRLAMYGKFGGKRLPPDAAIGESWELADLAETDASGAGGGEARSVIRSGALKGRTISEAMALWGPDLLGRARPTAWGGFPLLVKYLDARENLSVQVHPSEAYARAHPGAHLKTECWYVLEAEPGGVIYKGVREGVDAEALRASVAGGRVQDHLVAVPARAGEMHLLPSGTCHALGAGVLVAEIQTPSDTTFRMYDWSREYGRAGRELHVEQAMACVSLGPAPPAASRGDARAARLVETPMFSVDEVVVDAPVRIGESGQTGEDRRCAVVMCIAGSVRIEPARPGAFAPLGLGRGDTAVIPASLEAACAADEPVSILVARV